MLDLIGKAQAQTFAPPTLKPLDGTVPLRTLIISIGTFLIWIAGALALAYLVYGGILYITAGGDAEKATKGRTAVVNAVIGVIIVFMALVLIGWIKKFAQGSGI